MNFSFSHIASSRGIFFHLIRYSIMVLFHIDIELLLIYFSGLRLNFPSSYNSISFVYTSIVFSKPFLGKIHEKPYDCEKMTNLTHETLSQYCE
jgi:hypothetical protein